VTLSFTRTVLHGISQSVIAIVMYQ